MGLTRDDINSIVYNVYFGNNNNENEDQENDDSESQTSSIRTVEFYNSDLDEDEQLNSDIAKIIFNPNQINFPQNEANMSSNMTEESQNLADPDEVAYAKMNDEMEEMFRSPSPAPSPPENFDLNLNEDQEITLHFEQGGPPVEIQQVVETRETLPEVLQDDDDDLEVVFEKITSTHNELQNLPGVIKTEESEIKITQVQGSFRPFMVYKMDPDEPDIDDGTSSNEVALPIPEPVNIPVNMTLTESEIFKANTNQASTSTAVENHDEQTKKTNQQQKKRDSQKPSTSTDTSTETTNICNTANLSSTATATDAKPSPNSDKENKKKKKPKKPENETPRDTNINPNRIFKNKNKNPSNEQVLVADQQIDQANANANANVPNPNAAPVQGPLDFYSTQMENAIEFNLLFKEFIIFLRSIGINTTWELNEFYMLRPVYFEGLIKPTPYRFIETRMNAHADICTADMHCWIHGNYENITHFNPPTFEAFCLTIQDCINVREMEMRQESGGESQFRRPTDSMIKAICKKLYNHMLKEMEIQRNIQKERILQTYKDQRERFPGGNFPLIDRELGLEATDIYEFQDEIPVPIPEVPEIPTAEPEPTPESEEPEEPEIPNKIEKIILKKIPKDSETSESDDSDDPTYTPNGSGSSRKRKRKSNEAGDDGNNPPNKKKSESEYQSILVITID